MAQVTDSSSAPTKSPFTPPDLHAGTGATTPSSRSAQEEHNIERCIQDMDPSRSLTVSYVEGCNLECSYCALRWSARHVLDEQDS